MRTASLIAGFVLVMQPYIDVAWAADLFPDAVSGHTVRQDARSIPRQTIAYSGAVALPPCSDGVQLLLRCRPRPEIIFDQSDIAVLNTVAVEPHSRRRPYTQNFSWD